MSEHAMRKRAKRLLEGETLVVAVALSLGLDAVSTGGLAFIALDTSLATG